MAPSRTLAVVTSSRADWGHLVWPLRELLRRDGVALRLYVTGAHLAPGFGSTVREIEADGFEVHARVECLVHSDTDVGMAKTIGLAVTGFADLLARERPHLLVVIADRYEMLAPATAALALRIPLCHIEGGESSEGAIDHAVRNALTMLAHVHLTPTEAARRRVIAMGEEAWRVHRVGAPSLDHFRRTPLLPREEIAARCGIDPSRPYILVVHHPVTLDAEPAAGVDAVLEALRDAPETPVFLRPNADAATHAIQERVRRFLAERGDAVEVVNLPPVPYWSLLRGAHATVGNSSSGIMETPSLGVPAVNVGWRQRGRERAANVLDVPPESTAIAAALARTRDPAFRASLAAVVNPYGDGRSGERIAGLLAALDLGPRLLEKRTVPLEEMARGAVPPEE